MIMLLIMISAMVLAWALARPGAVAACCRCCCCLPCCLLPYTTVFSVIATDRVVSSHHPAQSGQSERANPYVIDAYCDEAPGTPLRIVHQTVRPYKAHEQTRIL